MADIDHATRPVVRAPITLTLTVPPVPDPAPPVPLDALTDIAAGLAHIERSVPLTTEDPETPRSIRLIATPDYDVWLITWPPRSKLAMHDHDGATSVIRLVQGSLVEVVDAQHRVLKPGVSVVTAPHTPHRLYNSTEREATSLHVYSPPLAAVTFLDPGPGRSLHPARGQGPTGPRPIRPREAEATSEREPS